MGVTEEPPILQNKNQLMKHSETFCGSEENQTKRQKHEFNVHMFEYGSDMEVLDC